ncbi:PIN-like domain-containing protein [Pseudomonas fragariae (ex Marin et al. 2024)]|uniref:PIN like domain-containing protein n=1 Tax=Pseudomonas syringae pv. syringae (strain B728a) TaxID=205918 RepID=Q4ZV49_PSEU2|nr:PIN domain-containing protein [Pseudomonas syringae]AAY36973.1 hypothetical protein Psyr_1929 [Pseudomonas syringae pv. syringae B728a]AKF45409.1 hypothetical protein PsyrB_09530 [Pseudomonas syringae pv. syringae B301D]EXL30672.1 hypothetical protein PssB301D_03136 [Pseudomonas syringae pv. syringae str. B301D-R]PYD13732.1 hypothetical protein DND47_19160 [Pseudomonas syringae pv. syringae]
MKDLFPGHFSSSDQDIENLWKDCIFVLDANVLLSLYRYSDSTRSELFKVFDTMSDRLWIPHQVAQEYLTNRLLVISEQAKYYDDASKRIEGLKKLLENSNQHPFVSSKTLNAASKVFEQLTKELSENRLIHDKRITKDEIKDKLEILFSSNVGPAYSKDRLEEVLIAGKTRYDEKTPPGFSDSKKGGDSQLFSDRCKPYGDYIVWLQMMDHSRLVEKSIIFVTGDVKEDWWTVFQGKTVGPHPSLVQEFIDSTGYLFYMYTPDKFLQRASIDLGINNIELEKSAQEIRDLQKEDDLLQVIFDETINSIWPEAKDSKPDIFGQSNTRKRIIRPQSDSLPEQPEFPWSETSFSKDGYKKSNSHNARMGVMHELKRLTAEKIELEHFVTSSMREGSLNSRDYSLLMIRLKKIEKEIQLMSGQVNDNDPYSEI